jgi:hypothetical protein
MDQTSLVMAEFGAGEQLLRHLQGAGFPVTAAAWIKEPDVRDWYLFIASPKVEDLGPLEAYSIVGEAYRQLPASPWFDPFRIRLIGATNPVAKDLAAFESKYASSAASPLRFYGPRLGDLSVEGAYIYSLSPNPAVAGS